MSVYWQIRIFLVLNVYLKICIFLPSVCLLTDTVSIKFQTWVTNYIYIRYFPHAVKLNIMFWRNFAFSLTSWMCMWYQPIEIDMTEEVRRKGREAAWSCLRSYKASIAPSILPTKYSLCPQTIEVLFLRILSKNIEPIYS